MSSERARVVIAAVQRAFLGVFLLALILPPVLCAFWELLILVGPALRQAAPLLAGFFDNFDAGAQSGFSRALFRVALALASVTALILPLGAQKRRHTVSLWGYLLIALGLFSVLSSPRLYAAETEWETWALLMLFGSLLSRLELAPLRVPIALALYLVVFSIVIQALVAESTVGVGRVGGVFQEPNILSTFCLISLPLLVWRSRSQGPDRLPATLLAGAVLALELWTGSLTGLALVFASFAYLALSGRPVSRGGGALSAMLWAIALNRAGSLAAAVALPSSLLLLALLAWLRHRESFQFSRVVVMAGTTAACLFFFANPVVREKEMNVGSLASRDNSFAARLHFYKAGGALLSESPLLGVGPGGFAHDYPRHQGSVRYFSKFIHCLPLELAVEWGVLAAACGTVAFVGWIRAFQDKKSPVPGAVWTWTLTLLFLHCLSGVQSQFPYLFALLVIALCVFRDTEESQPESGWFSLGRLFVSVVLLLSVAFNTTRAYSSLDRATALEVYRKFGYRGAEESLLLLKASALGMPLDEQAWFQWGLLLEAVGRSEAAVPLAQRALELDTRWAAPYELKFRGKLVKRDEIERALAIDPVNYPSFYRCQAELLYREGKKLEALSLLRERAPSYSPLTLNRLPDFRADDLKEQLVEYWLLVALLAEEQGELTLTEQAVRCALSLTENRVRRLKRLVTYPLRRDLKPGPMVDSFLGQLSQQIPAE